MNILDLKYLADEAFSRGWTVALYPEGVRVSTSQFGHHYQWSWQDLDGAPRTLFDRGLAWIDRKVAETA
jgi:hypothetical protein